MHSSESSDICRLLARSEPSPSSLHLLFTASAAHLISHRAPLSFSLSLSFSLLHFLSPRFSPSHSLSASRFPPRLPSDRPRDGADPRQERAVCLALQARLPTTWIVKTSGRHPARWCTVNQAFAYRIFDLRPGDALAMTSRAAPRRRERGNVRAASSGAPGDLTRSSTRLSLGWDNFQDARPLETRARAFERTATSCFFIAV